MSMINRLKTFERTRMTPFVLVGRFKSTNADISSHSELTPAEKLRITEWKNKLTPSGIDPKTFTMTYARSSGPGGQNVNKLNTKAMLRMKVDKQFWIPQYVKAKFSQNNATKINKLGEYVVSSERTRSQLNNYEDCIAKLCNDLKEASDFPKDPSLEQVERVNKLKEIEANRRKERKKFLSDKKSDRRFRID